MARGINMLHVDMQCDHEKIFTSQGNLPQMLWFSSGNSRGHCWYYQYPCNQRLGSENSPFLFLFLTCTYTDTQIHTYTCTLRHTFTHVHRRVYTPRPMFLNVWIAVSQKPMPTAPLVSRTLIPLTLECLILSCVFERVCLCVCMHVCHVCDHIHI